MSILSDRLRSARISAKLTLEELAKKSGISQAALQRYETGANIPTVDKIDKLIKVLNVSYDYLSGHESYDYSTSELEFISNILNQLPYGLSYSASKDMYFVYPPEILNDNIYDDKYWTTDGIEDDNNIEKVYLTPKEMLELNKDIIDYGKLKFLTLLSKKCTSFERSFESPTKQFKLDYSKASKTNKDD